MSAELARNKRIINPTQGDLIETVGKDYLEIDKNGQGLGEGKKKGRPSKRPRDEDGQNVQGDKRAKVGRPRKTDAGGSATPGGPRGGRGHSRAGSYSVGPGGIDEVKERKKPGPKKGSKNAMLPPSGRFGASKQSKTPGASGSGVKYEV